MPLHQPKAGTTRLWAWSAVALALLLVAFATLRPWGGAVGTFCIRCSESWLGDALLNVVLFVPLGFALRAAGASTLRALSISAATSLLIEVVQFNLVSGRFASPLDVLSNSAGGLVGALGFGSAMTWLAGASSQAGAAGMFIALWWIQCFVTAWALLPRVPAGPGYEGQWARVPPGFVPFAGRVVEAHLWSVAIPDGPVPDSAAIRGLVLDSTIAFTVKTEGLPRAEPIALVAALASGRTHRLASVSLAGCRLQARSGTNSERIGFNTPRIAVEGACVPLPAAVTIVVRQDGKHFSVERTSPGVDQVGTSLSLRPDIGWVMLAPLVTSERRRQVLTLAWIALFAFPVGVFGARANGGVARTVGHIVLLSAGTLLPAALFHTSMPTTGEVVFMAASMVAGATMASAIPRWPRRSALHLQR